MKKLIILGCLSFLATGLWAQNDQGAKVVPVSQAVQGSNGYTFQVGMPYLGITEGVPNTRNTTPKDIRFPWDVLYLYKTFNKGYFDVSKGYFGDKVLISWTIRNNSAAITNIKIFRQEFVDGVLDDANYVQIASVAATATEYEDKYVEGGVLYAYKIEVDGVSDIAEEFNTFITGIGFRSPTAIVTGNISFKGGNPVKDAVVKATSDGGAINAGAALKIPSAGTLEIGVINKPITTFATLQAWIRPVTPYAGDAEPNMRLFQLKANTGETIDVEVNLLETSKIVTVTIGAAEYRIHNFYPSGDIDDRGNDELVSVIDFNENFVHFSVVLSDGNVPLLYINGREMSASYKAEANLNIVEYDAEYTGTVAGYTGTLMDITVPTAVNTLALTAVTTWSQINVGSGKAILADEIRIWDAKKESDNIRTNFRRYINGNNVNLIAYLIANEGVGEYAYDLSRTGFDYNKNNGKLVSDIPANTITWVTGAGNIPSASQLGILGVTDEFGNYEITAIPYSGTGESFNITPLFGLHQFDPGQQLVFLGEGSSVVNKIDFVDISSFSFKGKVLFDSRGVFRSKIELNIEGGGTVFDPIFNDIDYVKGPGLEDKGYNYYQRLNEKWPKGQYWLNDNGTPYDGIDATLKDDDYLERYSEIFVEGANLYIDGEIVLDENNVPAVTDALGEFDISVPIGNHFITVKKDGHVFNYDGRFPRKPEIVSENDTGLYEFFEDANDPVYFIDNTRVTAVGRVVGGGVQAQKVIGFGENGLFEKTIEDANGDPKTIAISSKNNIGVANIALGYALGGIKAKDLTTFNFKTNSESGEFRVSVLPLNYELYAADIKIPSSANPIENTISILETGTIEPILLASVNELTTPEFVLEDGSEVFGEPYNHVIGGLNYRVDPVLKVLEQTSDDTIEIGDEIIDAESLGYKIFSQFKEYKIQLNSFERYVNYDVEVNGVEDIVPVVDGDFQIDNALELPGSRILERDPNDLSIINYTFKGGEIALKAPFTRSISIALEDTNGNITPAEEPYFKEGLLLGGQADDEQTFVTAAPDIPDIILRDPPGSNSFASIKSGQSFSFTSSSSTNDKSGTSRDQTISLGVDFEIGGGLAGPVFETDTTADVNAGISTSTSSSDGESITKTYSFSQTISTSNDPDYVGSDGDLYIGQSKNYFYGSFNKVEPSKTIPTKNVDGVLVTMLPDEYLVLGPVDDPLYISQQKAVYFLEEPAETFFIYSQKQIIDALIPDLQLLATQAITNAEKENDPDLKDKPEILTQEQYIEQVRLWRKMILENEKSKYLVKNDRANMQQSLITKVSDFNTELEADLLQVNEDTPVISGQKFDSDPLQDILNDKKEFTDKILGLLNNNFDDNISFDSGVGEFTRSVETTVIASKSTEFNLFLNESLALITGIDIQGVGTVVNNTGYTDKDTKSALSEKEKTTTTISYTLKDNDPANLLSVDVVNLFDGNGPIFSVLGGRTSCPYEGAERSNFYNNADYDPEATVIPLLAEDKREQLSFATQRVEVPKLGVTIAKVSNVLETKNAEFQLILENRSVTETDAVFILKVDNTTNPAGAEINIEPNGTLVNVPYGEETYYSLRIGKGASSVNEYENIRIVLESVCDGEDVSDDVLVSAIFVPSCSEVVVSAPLDNWVYNRDTAFNLDGSTNPLAINMIGFNTSFSSFEKIDLEYRLATSPNWTRLQTYYTQVAYDAAVAFNETNISLISGGTLAYSLDIPGLKLQDGDYEIRARTTCTNAEFISEVITGRVDLNSPEKFGTPLPIDGILGAGEDLRVSFNENITFIPGISLIQIKGQTNQLPIDNSVSLYFEGANNTATIEGPRLVSGDLTIEFWMNNATTAANATIVSQLNGIEIALVNGEMSATIGGINATSAIATDGLFHHYTITHDNELGSLNIFQDDTDLKGATGEANAQFTNNNSLVIGGNTFIGNIHDFRIWNKTISLTTAKNNSTAKLLGNEAGLIGYWPMNEGRGAIAKDLARFKNAAITAAWDIKPKGDAYEFANGQYHTINGVESVLLTNTMDATISFWIKTETGQESTIFSNGRGDGTDPVQGNGLTNKWAINMSGAGTLSFESEGTSYPLTVESVADNTWHHITLLLNRNGSLRTYVDAEQVSSNVTAAIGGFSANTAWLGARGYKDLASVQTVDREFTGKIDEFRLWSTLRNVDQISRDRFNEMDFESIGLLLYGRMNAPESFTGDGPTYYHAYTNQTIIPKNAVLSDGGMVNYSNDVPAIKPERNLTKFLVNQVVNGDEMIIEPVVEDWASLEGQILDITVAYILDDADNEQQSPITWTAFVQRNEMSWFVDGYNEVIDLVKNDDESLSFEITIINKGGLDQPYNIAGAPSWLSFSSASGTLSPDSKIVITATVDANLSAGEYLENLYLQTDFGLDEKLQLELRALAEEPDWIVDPTAFDYSMNIVGRISIDGVFSDDVYDNVAAFSNGELRGSSYLVYNEAYQEYFVFLTVYSNSPSGDPIDFSIWDATQGKILQSSVNSNSSITFLENDVLGALSNATLFENTNVVEQQVAANQGWTWVSMNVSDVNFANLNALIPNATLETSDRILSHTPARLETYYKDQNTPANSAWSGTISANGGLSTNFMYKVNFANAQNFTVKGAIADIGTWSFPIKQNWNWLPYPLSKNVLVSEALSLFDPVEGDIIKSQNLFAIYDALNGWSGTLEYLEEGQGYMIKSSKDQAFSYSNIFAKSSNYKDSGVRGQQQKTASAFTKYPENMNAVVLLPEGYNKLYVYDDEGVLKGQANNQMVGEKALSFITIYGENAKALTFYIGNGQNQKVTSKSISFKGNSAIGTVANPFVLEDTAFESIKMYPNPFKDDLVIHLNSQESQSMEVKLYSMSGQLVYASKEMLEAGNNSIKISPQVSNGVYFLNVYLNDAFTTFRVIKN